MSLTVIIKELLFFVKFSFVLAVSLLLIADLLSSKSGKAFFLLSDICFVFLFLDSVVVYYLCHDDQIFKRLALLIKVSDSRCGILTCKNSTKWSKVSLDTWWWTLFLYCCHHLISSVFLPNESLVFQCHCRILIKARC